MSIINLASPYPLFPYNGYFLGLYLTNTHVGRPGEGGLGYYSPFKILSILLMIVLCIGHECSIFLGGRGAMGRS